MSKILTETPDFDADVTVPEGGDARTAASVEAPFQKLTNRTAYLKDTPEISGEYRYDGARARVALLHLLDGDAFNADGTRGWCFEHAGGSPARWESRSDSGQLWFAIKLPDGAVLTRIRAIVSRNAGGSGNLSMLLKKNSGADFGASTAPTTATVDTETTTSSGTTLDMSGLSETFDADGKEYFLYFVANNDGGTFQDLIKAIELSWTELGPGRFA